MKAYVEAILQAVEDHLQALLGEGETHHGD